MEAGVESAGRREQRAEWSTEGTQRDEKPECKASITGSLWWQKSGAQEHQLCLKGQRQADRRGS